MNKELSLTCLGYTVSGFKPLFCVASMNGFTGCIHSAFCENISQASAECTRSSLWNGYSTLDFPPDKALWYTVLVQISEMIILHPLRVYPADRVTAAPSQIPELCRIHAGMAL